MDEALAGMPRRPVIVEHVAGLPGHGGPATALERLMASPLSARYRLITMRQTAATGGLDVAVIARWVRLLRTIRPDIVHVRGLGNEGFHGVLAARLAGCQRILLSIHGTVRDLQTLPTGRRAVLVNAVEPTSLRMATHISTVCRAAAERGYLDGFRHKIIGVVPNGTDVTATDHQARARLRADLDIAPDDIAVIVVGRLTIEKGHFILARALSHLGVAAAQIVLLVAGGGGDESRIEANYRSVKGLRLRMLGFRRDVRQLLDAADIFAFPTLHENLSNALIEAMAAGLPVVASRVGGNVEVLENGGGELIAPGDPEALAGALQRMVADADYRCALGDRATRVVTEKFSTDRMTAGWDSVYQKLLVAR